MSQDGRLKDKIIYQGLQVTKYIKEIASLLPTLSSEQLVLFTEKLSIAQLKLIRSKILPQITDFKLRKQLRSILSQQEQLLDSQQAAGLSESVTMNDDITHSLGLVCDHLKTTMLANLLESTEVQTVFLEKASDNQLAIIKLALETANIEEREQAFLALLEAETAKRKLLPSKEQAKLPQKLQEEMALWTSVNSSITAIKTEIHNQKIAQEVHVQPIEQTKPSWGYRFWSGIQAIGESIWSAIKLVSSFFSSLFSSSTPAPKPTAEKYNAELSSEEQEQLEKLRQAGAKDISAVTGVNAFGEAKERDVKNQTMCMASRIGMVAASQIVAGTNAGRSEDNIFTTILSRVASIFSIVTGTKGEPHGNIYTVISSLTASDDDDDAMEEIFSAVSGGLPTDEDGSVDPNHPLLGDHVASQGGFPELVTALENQVVQKLASSPDVYSQYGLTLSAEDQRRITQYAATLKDSKDIASILSVTSNLWGPYEPGPNGVGYKKIDVGFEQAEKEFEATLALESKALLAKCAALGDGEALYLETGLDEHAMQLVIRRVGEEFKISTYDSSGALENSHLYNSGIIGAIKLYAANKGQMSKNALSFTIPKERLVSTDGLSYLSELIRSRSVAGWAKTSLELQTQHTSMEERSHMGWFAELLALRNQSVVYSHYMKQFGSIALPSAPPEFEDLLQRPQNTQNCFAKKAQTCELHELGKPAYKKLRLAMLIEQKHSLLHDACGTTKGEKRFISGEYEHMVKNREPAYLSPTELHEASMKICEVKEPPSKEAYEKFFQALLDVRAKLLDANKPENQLAIKRIDEKIAQHAHSFYQYLLKGNRHEDIEEVFELDEDGKPPVFIREPGKMPLKTNADGSIDTKALAKISDYASAQAWVAIISILDHQIKKLSVNERHIASPSERLDHAKASKAQNVLLADLEDANVVSFSSGFWRTEEIKIEINIKAEGASKGTRMEIDKETFFSLVIANKNKEALTSPKVIGLLDYLRNASPAIAKRYERIVYPAQRKAFEDKMEVQLAATKTYRQTVESTMSTNLSKVSSMLQVSETNLTQLDKEIIVQEQLALGKNSVHLRCLKERQAMLREECAELTKLKASADGIIAIVQGNGDGSPLKQIGEAQSMLERLRDKESDIKTVNAIIGAFTKTQNQLAAVVVRLEEFQTKFEQLEIEAEVNTRVQKTAQYCQDVINHHLQANDEYRIIDELAAGRMGTEKDRNRYMYSQSDEERANVLKQGTNSYLFGSVFQKIQTLNQRIKAQIQEIVERKVLLKSTINDEGNIDSLQSQNDEYIRIDKYAADFSKEPIPDTLKKEWVHSLFTIWLQHENQNVLYTIQKNNEPDPTAALNHAFQRVLEQKANIKYAALKEAGYPIELSKSDMDAAGWKSISATDIQTLQVKQTDTRDVILGRFKAFMAKKPAPKKVEAAAEQPVVIVDKDLSAQHDAAHKEKPFTLDDVAYLEQDIQANSDGGTLKFLRENPTPEPQGDTQAECTEYYTQAASHLQKLLVQPVLENKAQRIAEFCHHFADNMFLLPHPSEKKLVTDLINTLLTPYKDQDEDENEFLNFNNLENRERAQLLTTLLKLQLSQIGSETTQINPKLYSIIKQWERLITPKDKALTERINTLSPDGIEPHDLSLLKEANDAVIASPVSLEGLYEGQKGLQISLMGYAKDEEREPDAQLRELADRLGIRVDDALLAHSFTHYFSNPKVLFSANGINTTQGREFFTRALLDAFQQAQPQERTELLTFLEKLDLPVEKEIKTLKTPNKVFIEELLVKCAIVDPELYAKHVKTERLETSETDALIKKFTDPDQSHEEAQGTDRLFAFAKEVNLLALKIEHASQKQPVDKEALDTLYTRLICSNLAYQLLLDQVDEEVLDSIKENFEFTRELSLLQSNINKLQDNLMEFTSNLNTARSTQFALIFDDYVTGKKFDGPPLFKVKPASSIIPGFITLGDNRSLDVLHGVVYLGSNKLGVMPSHIQSNIILQELGLNKFPFKQDHGVFVCSESGIVQATVTPLDNGELVVKRVLPTLGGKPSLLQYIPPEKLDSIPMSLRRRAHVEHFFIDNKGAIHGFNAQFQPTLKLSPKDDLWHGSMLDHQNKQVPIVVNSNTVAAQKLAEAFPQEELINIDEQTIYIPALAQYCTYNAQKDNFIMTASLEAGSAQKHLKITAKGSVYTEHVLSAEEQSEVVDLTKKIKDLTAEYADLAPHSGLLKSQEKVDLKKEINKCKEKINKLRSPEYFVFVPDAAAIKELEVQQQLSREKMQQAYSAFRDGGKDKDKLATQYEKAKTEYVESKKILAKAYNTSNHLRAYSKKGDELRPNDFQSILHIGELPGKATVLTKLLGEQVPTNPLKISELEGLQALERRYKAKAKPTMEEKIALVMVLGTQIQHHLLERQAVLAGKISTWDQVAYDQLCKEFSASITKITNTGAKLPTPQFAELWRQIQAEFSSKAEVQEAFAKPVVPVSAVIQRPMSIDAKTSSMPIESIGGRRLVQFKIHDNLSNLVQPSQKALENRLKDELGETSDSIQAQEDGYYYENYGLFNAKTLEKLFGATDSHNGIHNLNQKQIAGLSERMSGEWGWLRVLPPGRLQITRHPSDFYSSAKVASYLAEAGFERNQINAITDRLEIFLYQTAVNSGSYSVTSEQNKAELLQKNDEGIKKCTIAYLQALDKIESVLATANPKVTFAELSAAYLLNDYRKILPNIPGDPENIVTVLNNGMTRFLFHKTELNHLKEIKRTFVELKQDAKAIALLHTRRNYSLDKLLESELALNEDSSEKDMTKVEQDRKMQRAFLLFESQFGRRCNAAQVNIFRGLLLDEATNPDKIDSAQARMGFGKTSLLPLIALYKTGDKLVRFIVPKSALETNTADMSASLTNLLGSRAVKDDFQRYCIPAKPEDRLKALQDAKADLQKRLTLYERIRDDREVLVQAPSVRNSMQCQAQIFLNMLINGNLDPAQQKELMACISLLNKVRSFTTISVFDELDATQDPATTDVNYTDGKSKPFDKEEINPLTVITQTIKTAEDKSISNITALLLKQFKIDDPDGAIAKYVTSLRATEPLSIKASDKTTIYLLRAVLSDPIMLSIFTEKEAGADFGVWFENDKNGSRSYDYDALKGESPDSKMPLLIAVPYSAANTPKPKGSRFDNPEVTAITTLLFYLDSKTALQEVPHLEFLIDSFKNGIDQSSFMDATGKIAPQYADLLNKITETAEKVDPLLRNEQRRALFASIMASPQDQLIFREVLARVIIQEQIKYDPGKANSNRYEQGTIKDSVIGFSGTAGDTSFHFVENMRDAGADGNMTLGIMGRSDCQKTIPLDTDKFAQMGGDFTSHLIKDLVGSFAENTRTLIDVGGLCKASNLSVAKEIALFLKSAKCPTALKALKGVIFYDDVTNTKKFLPLSEANKEKPNTVDLTEEMLKEADEKGSYFTYYDQSHSRGADINQMNGAQAVLTVNFTVTNNNYKQGIMRMRKIIDKSLDQSYSIAVPKKVREKIISDLGLTQTHELTGNDIAFWLRQRELTENLNNVALLVMELDSVIKNVVLQQQAELTALLDGKDLTEAELKAFTDCITALNKISPFISENIHSLKAKYGKTYGEVDREAFISELSAGFKSRLASVFEKINTAREALDLSLLSETDKEPHTDSGSRIIEKRKTQLDKTFIVASSSSALAEVQVQAQAQSEAQAQKNTEANAQTNTFSQVGTEKVVAGAQLGKYDLPIESVSIDYLAADDGIEQLSLASAIPYLNNLFTEEDPVRCSPAYEKDSRLTLNFEQPIPPIRYLLARKDGNPKVILISQDEANAFKKLSNQESPWTLYDMRLRKSGQLNPIMGKPVATIKDSLLKKLDFAAFRYSVKGRTVDELSRSFSSICTPEQLKPSMQIDFSAMEHATAQDSIFTLPEWGFEGDDEQVISVNIEQTATQFTVKPTKDSQEERVFEKRGVAIRVGNTGDNQAEVFLSAKLNKRILSEEPSNPHKLKKVAEEVRAAYTVKKEERIVLRKELGEINGIRKKLIDTFDEEIAKLEKLKSEEVERAKTKIDAAFKSQMHSFFNKREDIAVNMFNHMQDLAMVGDGISLTIGEEERLVGKSKTLKKCPVSKTFTSLVDAITYFTTEILKKNQSGIELTDQQLEEELDRYIKITFDSLHTRYQVWTNYEKQNYTPIELLFGASKNTKAASKDISIIGDKLNSFLSSQFMDISTSLELDKLKNDPWDKLVTCFHDVISEVRTNLKSGALAADSFKIGNFYQLIYDRIKVLADDIADNYDDSVDFDKDTFIEGLMERLCFYLNPGDCSYTSIKEKHVTAVKGELQNALTTLFNDCLDEPSEEQMALFKRMKNILDKKVNPHEYLLPDLLTHFDIVFSNETIQALNEAGPIVDPKVIEEVAPIKKAIEDALLNQNVRTVDRELDFLTKKAIEYLIGRKAIQDLLENYKPVENRGTLKIKGKECAMFEETIQEIQILDTSVLDIQRRLDDARAQKQTELAKLESRRIELRGKLEENQEALTVLKGEKSALNKLIAGVKKLFSVFDRHQVKVEKEERPNGQKEQEETAVDFFESHFALGTIIQDQVSASATLTFRPPEVYHLKADIDMQEHYMHGVDAVETDAQKALTGAIGIVHDEAAIVQPRSCSAALAHALEADDSLADEHEEELEHREVQVPSEDDGLTDEEDIVTVDNPAPRC